MMTRAFVALTVFLVACGATVGREFDSAHAHDVKVGMSKANIQAWFGKPEQMTSMTPTDKGCVEQWIYKYAKSSGGSTFAKALSVSFDPSGAVCDQGYSEVNQ